MQILNSNAAIKTVVLIAGLFSLHTNQAHAWLVTKDFSLPASVDFDTNLEMRENNEQSIWLHRLTPMLRLTASNELNTFFIDGALRVQRSSDKNRSENRDDPILNAGWTRELERGQFGFTAHFDENTSRFAEFSRSGFVNNDGTVRNKSLNFNWTHLLTDRLTATSGAGIQKQEYSGVNLNGYTSKQVNARLSYLYNDKISPFIEGSLSSYISDNSNINNTNGLNNDSVSKSLSVGSRILISPRLDISASLGTNRISSAGSGWIAASNLNYIIDEKSTLNANLSRNISPSGLGDFQKSDSLSASYVRELTNRNTIGADLAWTISRSINSSESRQLSTWISRDLAQDWSIRAIAQLRQIDNNNQKADANLIGLTLTYNKLNFSF